jgi:hypothetical protein
MYRIVRRYCDTGTQGIGNESIGPAGGYDTVRHSNDLQGGWREL